MHGFAERVHLRAVATPPDDPVVLIDLDDLRTDGSPRVSGVDEEHVALLADVLDSVPPILVHRETLRVVDGIHRLHAARSLGRTRLPARLLDTAAADAFVEAVLANSTHGLPLRATDRKSAAGTILRTHPHWSDRKIAEVVGLCAKTVAAMRTPDADGTVRVARTGRDGKVRPIDGADRRRRAARLLVENPSLSLRQVAKLVGISPETARSVKARMSRGEDPAGGGRTKPVRDVPTRTDWASVVRGLRTDPSLRFTETGRTLLRLMEAHAVSPGRWESIASGVPPHCRSNVAAVAGELARAWHSFAEQLERGTE